MDELVPFGTDLTPVEGTIVNDGVPDVNYVAYTDSVEGCGRPELVVNGSGYCRLVWFALKAYKEQTAASRSKATDPEDVEHYEQHLEEIENLIEELVEYGMEEDLL